MSAIEREILEKFHQLQPPAKQRVLAMMQQTVASEIAQTEAAKFDFTAWVQEVEALREKLPRTDGIALLRHMRDGVE